MVHPTSGRSGNCFEEIKAPSPVLIKAPAGAQPLTPLVRLRVGQALKPLIMTLLEQLRVRELESDDSNSDWDPS